MKEKVFERGPKKFKFYSSFGPIASLVKYYDRYHYGNVIYLLFYYGCGRLLVRPPPVCSNLSVDVFFVKTY